MATSSNPRTPLREPKRKRDTGLGIFGLGSDDDDFCTPPRVTRKVANTTPLTPRSPNAAASPCGPKPRASRERTRGEHLGDSGPPVYVGGASDLEESEEEEEDGQPSDQPYASKGNNAKAACTKGKQGAWRQSHLNLAPAVDEDGNPLIFDAHFEGLQYFDVPGLNYRAIAQSVNGIADEWDNNPSSKGSFYTYSGGSGMSSQARGPPGGATAVFDREGLRPTVRAIKEAGGLLGTSRFMPGDGKRRQTSHADGGNPDESRLLLSCDVLPDQPSSSLSFTLRQDASQRPRGAALVPDPTTGEPLTRVYLKRHATCVIGDGVAFGRSSGMLHEVVPAPAAPDATPAGSLTILVDITWPDAATRKQKIRMQKDLEGRLAAIEDVDRAETNYTADLQNPRKEDVDPSNLSASNTAYDKTEIQLADGTTTTNASKNANSCSHDDCACVSDEVDKCVCKGHLHNKNASVAGRTGGANKKPSGEQQRPNSNARGPGGPGEQEFDYTRYRRSIGYHHRGYAKGGELKMSDGRFEFFEYSIGNVEKGAWALGTQPFNSAGKRVSSYPYRGDGTRFPTKAKVEKNNSYLMGKARDHANAPQG